MAASAANLQQNLFSRLKCGFGPGAAGLPTEPLFRTADTPRPRTVPNVAIGRQSMTRRWQFYDYLNTRIGCGAEDRKGYILPTVKTTARGITMS